jgi:antitoxin ParD1/3/4
MNVSLTSELEKFIRQKVESGEYQTSSEVVREALRLLRTREAAKESRLNDLRADILVALEQAKNGQILTLDPVKFKNDLRKRFKARPRIGNG